MIRLLLALLLLALALPAAARPACHAPAMPAAAAHHGGHHAPQPAPIVAEHVCIGCIPPGDSVARIVTPALAPVAPEVAVVTRLDLGGGPAPALPPPRRG